MQAAGRRIRPATKFASGVQFGQHELHTGQLGLWLLIDRDTSSVVTDKDRPAGLQDHLNLAAMPRQRLVHGVVENLPQAVHQPAAIVASDIHAGPLAHRIEALKNRQIPGRVGPGGLLRRHFVNAIATKRHLRGSARCRSPPIQLHARGGRQPRRPVSPPANSVFRTGRNREYRARLRITR